MSTSQTSTTSESHRAQDFRSEVEALEHDIRWQQATPEQRVLLQRIATQRDRWALARQVRQAAPAGDKTQPSVSADAPLAERLAGFAKLHPLAATAVVGLALMLGPRKLIRYGGIAWPLISKLRR